jgi:hypothetical protein
LSACSWAHGCLLRPASCLCLMACSAAWGPVTACWLAAAPLQRS